MSEETTTQTPAENGGTQPGSQSAANPPATPLATQPGAAQSVEPYRTFATEADLNRFMGDRAKRAERSALNRVARENGFEDWQDMNDALATIRRTPENAAAAQPTTPEGSQPPDAAARLNLALSVAEAKGLPVTLVTRLQGNTKEDMEADADRLLALITASGGAVGHRGVPGAPQGQQPVTFTQAQLSDPKFVREHQTEIRQAYAEGRIVRS